MILEFDELYTNYVMFVFDHVSPRGYCASINYNFIAAALSLTHRLHLWSRFLARTTLDPVLPSIFAFN